MGCSRESYIWYKKVHWVGSQINENVEMVRLQVHIKSDRFDQNTFYIAKRFATQKCVYVIFADFFVLAMSHPQASRCFVLACRCLL